MNNITKTQAVVYYAPTARRHYLTKRGASLGEARARIKRKYPSEPPEYVAGHCVDRGWFWGDLPNSEKLLKRYARLLSKHTINVI